MSRAGVILVAALAVATAASAWPVTSEVRVANGLRCFPDHEIGGLWWYVPQRLELASEAGRPGFSFHRYRYKGSAATGDSDRFWARGVMGLSVTFQSDAAAVAGARTTLQRSTGRPVRLELLPIKDIESVVVYAGASSDLEGNLADGDWEDAEGGWEERSFTLRLEPRTSELLWDAFHADGLALSLSYTLVGLALEYRPPSAGEEEPEPVARVVGGDALPVRVSPGDCAECFRTFELDAKIPADYPFLEVRCHDFESPEVPRDLRLVVVQIKATAVNGDRPVEQVEFVAGEDGTKAAVRFRFAVELGEGYEYQVTREYDYGSEPEPWREVDSWTGSLDVSRYRTARAEMAGLNPRELY